jgi:hypothetical protein
VKALTDVQVADIQVPYTQDIHVADIQVVGIPKQYTSHWDPIRRAEIQQWTVGPKATSAHPILSSTT